MRKVKLRKLNSCDAPLMLEWMHNKEVVKWMQADFQNKTLDDCKAFICQSNQSEADLHMAIVDENDEYMGTVSLKNIEQDREYAEFAITIRECAMGRGFAQYGMREIIRIGLKELGIKKIIWCVSKDNIRANKFYNKMRYSILEDIPAPMKENYMNWNYMNWFYCDSI